MVTARRIVSLRSGRLPFLFLYLAHLALLLVYLVLLLLHVTCLLVHMLLLAPMLKLGVLTPIPLDAAALLGLLPAPLLDVMAPPFGFLAPAPLDFFPGLAECDPPTQNRHRCQ